MAYLANDPNKEQENEVGMNVINPVDQGESGNMPQDGQNQGSSGSDGSGGVIQASPQGSSQNQSQGQSSSKGQGGKGSSGMFTNIRKYVDANKPQASKMAGAAAKTTEKEAQQIGNQVSQQQNKLQVQLDKNKQNLNQAKEFAQGQIDNAASGANDLSQENVDRFRNLATGKESFNDVQEMNLAKQQLAAKRLEQQGMKAGTEQGRQDLLKNTFGQGDRAYTRGQQGLDALIVGGDADARTQLQNQVQQAASQANQGIQTAAQNQATSIQDLQQQNQNFAQGLQDQTSGAATKFIEDADAAMLAAQEARKQQVADLEAQASGFQERISGLQSGLDMSNQANREKLMRDLGFFKDDKNYAAGNRRWDGRVTYDKQHSDNINAQNFINTGDINALTGVKHKMDGRVLDQMLRNSALGNLANYGQDLSLVGIDPNIYGGSFDAESNNLRSSYADTAYGEDIGDLITGGGGRKYLDASRVIQEINALNKKIGGFNTQDFMQKQLGEIQGGLSLDQFKQGADISRESVSTPEQIARYQALSKLAGGSGSDLIAENRQDLLDQEEFANYMNKLKGF